MDLEGTACTAAAQKRSRKCALATAAIRSGQSMKTFAAAVTFQFQTRHFRPHMSQNIKWQLACRFVLKSAFQQLQFESDLNTECPRCQGKLLRPFYDKIVLSYFSWPKLSTNVMYGIRTFLSKIFCYLKTYLFNAFFSLVRTIPKKDSNWSWK